MNLKGKNVLVTGGTGFVGSHLVEALVNQGARVTATMLVNDPFSYFSTQKLGQKVNVVNLNVCNFEAVFDTIVKQEIEYIFHLAAQALVEVAYHNPKQTLLDNVIGTVNILESARLYPKVSGVIVASSDKAYGKLEANSKYIEETPLRGDHPYEVSKSAADLICTSYFKTYKTPVVITRFGNIYGEGDLNLSRIVPGTINCIVNNKRLDIRSNGKHIRDYLYVKDVVDGYLVLAKNIETAKGQAYNFGSYDTLSVIDVINTIQKVFDKKINYKILDISKNEIPYQSLSFDKINKEYGWKPQYSFDQGIKKSVSWYKEILKLL